jgi:hypothetical protein
VYWAAYTYIHTYIRTYVHTYSLKYIFLCIYSLVGRRGREGGAKALLAGPDAPVPSGTAMCVCVFARVCACAYVIGLQGRMSGCFESTRLCMFTRRVYTACLHSVCLHSAFTLRAHTRAYNVCSHCVLTLCVHTARAKRLRRASNTGRGRGAERGPASRDGFEGAVGAERGPALRRTGRARASRAPSALKTAFYNIYIHCIHTLCNVHITLYNAYVHYNIYIYIYIYIVCTM